MLAFNAVKVVIKIVKVAYSLANQKGDVIILELQMEDELAVGDLVIDLLLLLELLNWEHVKAVDFLHLTFGLSHTDLINFATERLAFGRCHLVEFTRE